MVTTRSSLQLTEGNLILTGYIEPNKPRIGRQVAQQLRMPFVDVAEVMLSLQKAGLSFRAMTEVRNRLH